MSQLWTPEKGRQEAGTLRLQKEQRCKEDKHCWHSCDKQDDKVHCCGCFAHKDGGYGQIVNDLHIPCEM